jgi:hypothetical protein
MNSKNGICTPNLRDCDMPRVPVPSCPTHERLARAFSRLEDMRLVRNEWDDPSLGKFAEERIIWRELLDLELHDVDEQIERISASVDNGSR